MADKDHKYGTEKTIKLKDLVKPSGFEPIPDKWLDKKESPKRDMRPDLILPVDKQIVLKADSQEYQRGLIVTWKKDGGYDVQYWYETPDNIVPAELKADGTSKGKSVKKVYLGYHPEIDDK